MVLRPHPNYGRFAHISRTDFYNGDVATEYTEYVGYGALEPKKTGYHTHRIEEDLWLLSLNRGDRRSQNEETSANPEIWAMYDDGARIAKVYEYTTAETTADTSTSLLPEFPLTAHSSAAGRHTAINRGTGRHSQVHQQVTVAYSADGMDVNGVEAWIDPILPNESRVRVEGSDGSFDTMLTLKDNDIMSLVNPHANNTPGIKFQNNVFQVGWAFGDLLTVNGNANEVSLEGNTLTDPSNSTTGDEMTADPDCATEDGYVEVDIGGTICQIPIYQA